LLGTLCPGPGSVAPLAGDREGQSNPQPALPEDMMLRVG